MNKTTRPAFALALSLTALAACADAPGDASVTRREAVAPGGPSNEAVEPGPEPAAVPGITSTRPCGEYTTARVPGAAGQTLTVCTMPGGRELIAITGDAEHDAPEAARPRCALDVFLTTAALGVPVPRVLVDSCAKKTGATPFTAGRAVVDHPVFVDEPIATDLSPKGISIVNGSFSYCGASGATDFHSARCYNCSGFDPDECASVCVPELWGTSQRTCVEGDTIWATVASCGGSTRVRAFWREGSGDPWLTVHDDQIPANRYQRIYIADDDSFADADMRVRAESASGAGHRHSFMCYDN